jgi:MFS family permease
MKKRGKSEKGFRNIFLLGESSFLNDVGSEMITPILPFYVTSLGGGGLAIGLISGLREGLASFLKFFGGWLSDRTGKRRVFIFLGYFISIIFRFLLAMVSSWQLIISFVSLERFGKLRDAPRDALITQSTKKRGRGLGFHQMMDTAGGVVGTIIVIFLFWKLQLSFKTIIFIAAGISAFALLPLIFVREQKIKRLKDGIFRSIHKLSPKLKYFIFVSSIFTLANFGLYLFILLRIKEITGSIVISLVLYAVFSLVYASFVIPFGCWSDKVGRKKILVVGYVLFFLVSLGFIFLQNILYISILFVFYGLVYAMTQSNQRALVSDLCGKMKGTAFGFYSSIVGLVNILGGVIAGLLWDVNPIVMFAYISIVAFVSIIFLLFIKENHS